MGSLNTVNTGTTSVEKVFLGFIRNLFHEQAWNSYSVTGIRDTRLNELCPQTSRTMQSLEGDHTQFVVTPPGHHTDKLQGTGFMCGSWMRASDKKTLLESEPPRMPYESPPN